jgi:hypothetical protein
VTQPACVEDESVGVYMCQSAPHIKGGRTLSTILALTVGGSCEPIITAVRDYEPDLVCFIATGGPRGSRVTVDGPGQPCGRAPEQSPSIVGQLGLAREAYRVLELDDPDDLPAIYAACRDALRQMAADAPNARLIADYTGGSKTMGVGLALAALDTDWQLSLVKGMRTDLIRVIDRTQMAGLVNTWEVLAHQRMEEARRLFNAFAYKSAGEILEGILRQRPVSQELEHTIRTWVVYCRGFDAWDRFDHGQAVQLLETVPGQGIDWRFLKTLAGQAGANGYAAVLDLVLNAERRASRGRYDDAVARLYRAIELLAQTRLAGRDPALDSSDLDLDRLPEALRDRYARMREINQLMGRGDKVAIGLMEDYTLLRELDDPMGGVFSSLEGRVRHAIEKRNQSILAHGTRPLTRDDYELVRGVAHSLLSQGLAALGERVEARQFPTLTSEGLVPRDGA